MDSDGLLSRADMVEAIGVDDVVLGFWLKHDLLISEPVQPRKHRRFKPSEARIGCVLAELRKCGGNVSAMRALSAQLRDGVRELEAIGLGSPKDHEIDATRSESNSYFEAIGSISSEPGLLGQRLLTGEGLLRLYQLEEDTWKLDDGTYTDRLPVNSAVYFDCWKIFGNVRPDDEDLHH